MSDQLSYLPLLLPLAIISIAAMAALMAEVFSTDGGGARGRGIAIGGLLLASLCTLFLGAGNIEVPAGAMIMLDGNVAIASLMIFVAALATLIMAEPELQGDELKGNRAEFSCLVLLAAAALHLLAMSTELITAFIAIEMSALCLFVLAGFRPSDLRAREAAFKYFLLAAFSSAFLVMGIAFIYGATGSTVFAEIRGALFDPQMAAASSWAKLGMVLLLTGLAFKLTLAPFHMYASDVYSGAPLPAVNFIATGSKVGGFMLLMHLVPALVSAPGQFNAGAMVASLGIPVAATNSPIELGDSLTILILFLALASMIVGNLGAFLQGNLKRLLAYSSIAHAGYLGLGFAALTVGRMNGDTALVERSMDAIVLYLVAYTLMNVLAFGILALLGEEYCEKKKLAGLGRREPLLAFAMTIAMISLLGIPPAAGFWGKLEVFMAAIAADLTIMAIIGVLFSILSAYYYLDVIVVMFFGDEEDPATPNIGEGAEEARAAETPFAVFRQQATPLVYAMSIAVLFGGLIMISL